jgi:hypothetical protein
MLQRDPSRLRNWKVASPGRGLEGSDAATAGVEASYMRAIAQSRLSAAAALGVFLPAVQLYE